MTDRIDPALAEKALVAAEAAASATGEMVPEYQIRAALTAIADVLRAEGAAEALREASDAMEGGDPCEWPFYGLDEVQHWLRARAYQYGSADK